MIDTQVGPRDPSTLVRDEVYEDTPDEFALHVRYYARETMQMVRHEKAVIIDKHGPHPFMDYPGADEILTEYNGVRETVPVASLEKKLGADDSDNAFVPWVEFRKPGTDDIVHRNIHIFIKRGLSAGVEQGAAAGGPTLG